MRQSRVVPIAAIAAAAALTLAPAAGAAVYSWSYQAGDPGTYGMNPNGGAIASVSSTYDSVTELFTWSVTFSDTVTRGLTLAVNNGPNPKGHAGELALLYVDANDPGDVRVTAYNYNGKNRRDSFKDGDGLTNGAQPADLIADASHASFVVSASRADAGGSRTISFAIDASVINAHTPMYPGTSPWYGIGFDTGLGLWMHTYRTFDPTYDAQTGAITALSAGGEGWFDGAGFAADVPAPGAGLLAGLGLLTASRRRRG
jgi:hypothetical protein